MNPPSAIYTWWAIQKSRMPAARPFPVPPWSISANPFRLSRVTPRTSAVLARWRSISVSSSPLRPAKTTKCEQSSGWRCPHDAADSLSRIAGSCTTTNRQGCSPIEDGESTSASSSAAQVAAGILRVGSNFFVA